MWASEIMGAGCAALAQVFIRKTVFTEKTTAIVFYFTLTSTVLSLLTIPFGWEMPGSREAMLLILAGLFGGIGQILLTSSYRFADASVIAPFVTTYVIGSGLPRNLFQTISKIFWEMVPARFERGAS